MRKSKGFRRETRSLLRKRPRDRGKLPLSRLLHEYQPGDRVVVKIDPSVHKGMPHRRFHGKVGVLVGRRGRAYIVQVTQGNKAKEIIVRPEHLRPFTGG